MNDEIRKVVTESIVTALSSITAMCPVPDSPLPDFIQKPIDRAVERILELFPLLTNQVEITGNVPGPEELKALLDEFLERDGKVAEAVLVRVNEHAWFSKAATDVTAERRRQIEAEGYTFAGDDLYCQGQLAAAGAAYALVGCAATFSPKEFPKPPAIWPWEAIYWKPISQRACLVKAGALLIAEIERIDRMELEKNDE